jgi:hypothetical protein
MIWNCDNFSRWNTKFGKIHIVFNLIFIQNWLQKKNDILQQLYLINKKFQNISFENSSLWKHVFWAKGQ